MATLKGYPKTPQYGGNGGSPFTDDLTEVKQLIAVSVRHGDRIDAILGVWKTESGDQVTGEHHGGYGGNETIFVLETGEKIVNVTINHESTILGLIFRTSNKHEYRFGNNTDGTSDNVTGDILGFFGHSGEDTRCHRFLSRVKEALA